MRASSSVLPFTMIVIAVFNKQMVFLVSCSVIKVVRAAVDVVFVVWFKFVLT